MPIGFLKFLHTRSQVLPTLSCFQFTLGYWYWPWLCSQTSVGNFFFWMIIKICSLCFSCTPDNVHAEFHEKLILDNKSNKQTNTQHYHFHITVIKLGKGCDTINANPSLPHSPRVGREGELDAISINGRRYFLSHAINIFIVIIGRKRHAP